MENNNKKWLKIMALAMSFPSTIFIMAYGVMKLHELGYIEKSTAAILFVLAISNTLFLMVYYAFKRKN